MFFSHNKNEVVPYVCVCVMWCAVLLYCWDSFNSVGFLCCRSCYALIHISRIANTKGREKENIYTQRAYTHTSRNTRTAPDRWHVCCCFIYSTPLLNVFIASFLLTLTFVRAHPSVKLGTFTRLDTKKKHSSKFTPTRRSGQFKPPKLCANIARSLNIVKTSA